MQPKPKPKRDQAEAGDQLVNGGRHKERHRVARLLLPTHVRKNGCARAWVCAHVCQKGKKERKGVIVIVSECVCVGKSVCP